MREETPAIYLEKKSDLVGEKGEKRGSSLEENRCSQNEKGPERTET